MGATHMEVLNMTKLNKEIKEQIEVDGFIDIKSTVIYTNWKDEYKEKNFEFFQLLINCEYDELILSQSYDSHIYYDLITIVKDDEKITLPRPVVMESLFMDDYNVYKQHLNESYLIWFDINDNVEYRQFTKIMYREEFYQERQRENNIEILNYLDALRNHKMLTITDQDTGEIDGTIIMKKEGEFICTTYYNGISRDEKLSIDSLFHYLTEFNCEIM
jgi:hypothetical protein